MYTSFVIEINGQMAGLIQGSAAASRVLRRFQGRNVSELSRHQLELVIAAQQVLLQGARAGSPSA